MERIDKDKFWELVNEALPLWKEYLELEEELLKVQWRLPGAAPGGGDLFPIFHHLDHYHEYKPKEKDLRDSFKGLSEVAVKFTEIGIEPPAHFVIEDKGNQYVMSIYSPAQQPESVALHFSLAVEEEEKEQQ